MPATTCESKAGCGKEREEAATAYVRVGQNPIHTLYMTNFPAENTVCTPYIHIYNIKKIYMYNIYICIILYIYICIYVCVDTANPSHVRLRYLTVCFPHARY
jgi:hypothetical protein